MILLAGPQGGRSRKLAGLLATPSPRGPAYQGDSWDDPTGWEESGETAEDCEGS